jgi:DNA mismatch repair protein MutS
VPFHSATSYINRLLAAGKRVAICEQTTEASAGKGIVQREIVRIVSPGMAFDNDALAANQNNFLVAIQFTGDAGNYAALDASTGDYFFGAFASQEELAREISLLSPREFLIAESDFSSAEKILRRISVACVTPLPDYYFDPKGSFEDLCRHFSVLNLEAFAIKPGDPQLAPLGAAYRRLRESQKTANLCHLREPKGRFSNEFLRVDESTFDHLDVFPKADRSERESLFYHLDQTLSAMGARELRRLLQAPLLSIPAIEARQDAIAALMDDAAILEGVRSLLRGLRDLERLTAKVGMKSASPRDLLALGDALTRIPHLAAHLKAIPSSSLLADLAVKMDSFDALTEALNSRLREDTPPHAREGGIFKTGWHSELDELITLSTEGSRFVEELEARERSATGISSLKIRYNRVFGYYIEITKTNLSSVPAHYVRRQTTANAERFLTEELREFEDKILRAEERRVRLESRLFDELLDSISQESRRILRSAEAVAWLDALQGLAKVAREANWARPELHEGLEIEIEDARHPMLESLLGRDRFVANDVHFSTAKKIFVLTGPNMAGKSTFMRQAAIQVLLAQLGSFVPAKKARIGIVDQIASRVGASDRIGQGQSTFMVEMNEMARILRQATPKSLLIIDEIGRGTSTFDGLALAWAILEDIQSRLSCRTLFATHYHELTALEGELSGLGNLAVAIRREKDSVLFLHKVEAGTADGSHGIEVAKLAGVPDAVVARAGQILKRLEKSSPTSAKAKKILRDDQQMSFSDFASEARAPSPAEKIALASLQSLADQIHAIDLDRCTPLDALLQIKALKEKFPPARLQ